MYFDWNAPFAELDALWSSTSCSRSTSQELECVVYLAFDNDKTRERETPRHAFFFIIRIKDNAFIRINDNAFLIVLIILYFTVYVPVWTVRGRNRHCGRNGIPEICHPQRRSHRTSVAAAAESFPCRKVVFESLSFLCIWAGDNTVTVVCLSCLIQTSHWCRSSHQEG